LQAQKELSNKIGVTFSSLGTNDIFEKSNTTNYNYEGENFYTLGLTYIRGFNKWLEIETGLEYSRHNINIALNIMPGTNAFKRTQKTNISLLNIPVTLRFKFLKYFFVNGGVLIDIDASNSVYFENQTGFGAIAGFGANYDFDCGLSVFLNPYIKAHSWIDVGAQQKILEKGFRLGVAYDLRKIFKKK
jgi:long-subunit fatty acid transport protein